MLRLRFERLRAPPLDLTAPYSPTGPQLVRRAEDAGYVALLLTVDTPVPGRREADLRNRFALPPGLRLANLPDSLADGLRRGGEGEGAGERAGAGAGGGRRPTPSSGLHRFFAEQMDPSLTWADVAWLCSSSRLPVFVKVEPEMR